MDSNLSIRLENLSKDLGSSNGMLLKRIKLLNITSEELMELYKVQYALKNSYAVSSKLSTISRSTNTDITDCFLNFSDGMNSFISAQMNDINNIIEYYIRASNLLISILNLPAPYNAIYYLKFISQKKSKDIQESMFISKTTYFRYCEKGAEILKSILDETEEELRKQNSNPTFFA